MCQQNMLSPQLRAKMHAIANRAAVEAQSAKYVIYAMLDPRAPDPAGDYPALPVYVGMSRDVATRIRRRYHDAFEGKRRDQPTWAFLRTLAGEDHVAQFAILHRSASAVDIIEAEIDWAQALLAKGYTLLNRMPEQRRLVPACVRDRYVQKRLWNLSMAAAICEGLRISSSCCWCGRVSVVQPQQFSRSFRAYRAISSIRGKLRDCVNCGTGLEHRIVLPHEAAVGRAPESLRDWEC